MTQELKDVILQFVSECDTGGRIIAAATQGGYARGTALPTSDVDLVFVFNNEIEGATHCRGFIKYKNIKFEIRHLYLDKTEPKKWAGKKRYIYANETETIYDTDNKLKSIIDASRMDENERISEVVSMIRSLGKCGLVFHNMIGQEWRGFYWEDPIDYWVSRKEPFIANLRLNECNIRLARLIYAINKQYAPSSKYLFYLLKKLPWIPNNLFEIMERANILPSLSKKTFYNRVKAYQDILDACIDKTIELDILPINFEEYYSNNFIRFMD